MKKRLLLALRANLRFASSPKGNASLAHLRFREALPFGAPEASPRVREAMPKAQQPEVFPSGVAFSIASSTPKQNQMIANRKFARAAQTKATCSAAQKKALHTYCLT